MPGWRIVRKQVRPFFSPSCIPGRNCQRCLLVLIDSVHISVCVEQLGRVVGAAGAGSIGKGRAAVTVCGVNIGGKAQERGDGLEVILERTSQG